MMEERDREERSIEETPRTRNKRLALVQEKKRLETEQMSRGPVREEDFDSPTDSRGLGFDPRQTRYSATSGGGGGPIRDDQQYSREEAWYFLRALVGQELEEERSLLWKLQNLDPREDMFGNNDA
jgi:hypothetical protein